MLALAASAVTKTYVWSTNTWKGAPSVDLGRVRFPDGSWAESDRGIGEPEYHAHLEFRNTGNDGELLDTKGSYDHIVFCNGRAVQIEACPTNTENMSRISWSQYTKTSTRHFIDVPNNCYIFGGGNGVVPWGGSRGDRTDANFMNTSITMFGGSAKAIYGGSLGFGSVATSTITIGPGGQVTDVYAGGEGKGGGGFTETTHPDDVRRNFVGHTTIRVTRATNDLEIARVYGGGHSVTDVSVSDIIITGGPVGLVYAGSSSGMVGTGHLVVSGTASIGTVYPWSRGYTGFAKIDVEGGTVGTVMTGGGIPVDGSGGRYMDATGGWCMLNLTGGTVGHVTRGRNTLQGQTAGPSGPLNYRVSGTYVKGVVQSEYFNPDDHNLVKAVAGIDEAILLGPEEDEREITGAGFAQYEFPSSNETARINGWFADAGEDYRISTNTPLLTLDSLVIARNGFAKIVATNGSLQAALDSKASTNTVLPYILLKDSGNGNVYRIGIQNGALTPVQQ